MTSWGKEANWYDDYLSLEDSYQKQVIMPNLLRIASPLMNKKVLDLACGQGIFSEIFLNEGAVVTGVDISPELIAIAKKRIINDSNKSKINFMVSSAHKIIESGVKENYYDLAICVLASQNIKEFDATTKEVFKSIKKGGKFVIVLNHPCFRIPQKTDWYFDERGEPGGQDLSNQIVNGRRVGRFGRVVYGYMSEESIKIDMHPGEKNKNKKSYTYSFHRPMQTYTKWLSNAGFYISRMEEWITHKNSTPGPKELADKKAKKEIPMFMCIEAIKLN